MEAFREKLALRPKEAAAQLGISLRTLCNWRESGLISVCKVGVGKRKTILVPQHELKRILSVVPATISRRNL